QLLTGGRRDAPERQQTLRTTLDWSHDLLGEDEQQLFARLAVFEGGCTLGSVEAVCSDGDVVLDALAGLVDESLVRQQGEDELRFSMLETVREYALEHLARSGEEEELRRRHLEHFLALAEAAEPELFAPDQLASLEDIRGQALAKENLGLLELTAGDVPKAVRWLTEARDLAREAGVNHEIAAASRSLAAALIELGETERARKLLDESLALSRE